MILPLRLYSATLPRRISAIIRKPSYLSSKTQPGSSNAASVSVASIGRRRLGRVDVRLIRGQSLRARCEMHGRPSRIRERLEAASCSAGAVACETVTNRSGRTDQTDGQKTEDLSDLAGLLRSGDRRAIYEGGSGGVGRRQQSLSSGRGDGERRPGRHRRDYGKARCRSQASGGNRPTFQRTCRATHRSCRRRTNESRRQVETPKGEEVFLSARRQGCGAKAALACDREQRARELERAREEAARQKERERRQRAIDKAQAALDKAEQEHEESGGDPGRDRGSREE